MSITVNVSAAKVAALNSLFATTDNAVLLAKFQELIDKQLDGILKQQSEISEASVAQKYKTLSDADKATVSALIDSKYVPPAP